MGTTNSWYQAPLNSKSTILLHQGYFWLKCKPAYRGLFCPAVESLLQILLNDGIVVVQIQLEQEYEQRQRETGS